MTQAFWRRLDSDGLERLTIEAVGDGLLAQGSIVAAVEGGASIEHQWRLNADWQAQSVMVRRVGKGAGETLRLERTPGGWSVDGVPRPDLDGAEEPDLSLTPFCNTLVTRRLPITAGAARALATAYIDGARLTVQRSRQRYERIDANHVRYVDLGVAAGFEAVITLGADGLVDHYEHLFERRPPPPTMVKHRGQAEG